MRVCQHYFIGFSLKVKTMLDLKSIKNTLIQDEGCKLKPYRCTAGKLTIGVGRNLDDVGLSQEEAEYLLDNDIKNTVIGLERALPMFDELSPARQAVLVNMAFNMGLPRLLGFHKFIAALAERDFPRAMLEMRTSKWASQLPERSARLEITMYNGE